jgi:signal transduction histidine kinase
MTMTTETRDQDKAVLDSYAALAREILDLAYRDISRPEFLQEVSRVVLDASRCDACEIYLVESGIHSRSTANNLQPTADGYEIVVPTATVMPLAPIIEVSDERSFIALCCNVLSGRVTCSDGERVAGDSFWTGSATEAVELIEVNQYRRRPFKLKPTGSYKSVVVVGFDLDGGNRGLLVLKTRAQAFFDRNSVEFLKNIGQLLGVPVVHHRTELALRERIKELTCLYEIEKLAGRPEASLEEILRETVGLFPGAWQHPSITSGRIEFGGESYRLPSFREGCDSIRANIVIEDRHCGFVEVIYTQKRPDLDEGPFLREERQLIDAIARRLAHIIDQYTAELERSQLQEQLRHADRLATIGQFSAGVAHELNEPLGGILGFAQLAQKNSDVPEQAQKDLEKIVSASLHAREIVKKLMLFARQTVPDKNWVDLNMLVADGLYFIESRCQKAGIELIRNLDGELPEVPADSGQIYQVLINLAVNAIQAMPSGGELRISTAACEAGLRLQVEDNGTGMSDEIRNKIFMPFFTTKDVGDGTGLGLSVVEGIVTSHGGTIAVESSPGKGTKFTILLPSKKARPDRALLMERSDDA